MNLYFIRHAIAEDPNPARFSEAERPLTEEGQQKMELNAQGLRRLGLPIELILSSPWKRAWETASIIRQTLKLKNEIIEEPLLIPESNLEQLLKKLSEREEKNIALVGHEPSLSLWVRRLLEWPIDRFDFKKGAVIQLKWNEQWKLDSSVATLELFLKPHELRQLK